MVPLLPEFALPYLRFGIVVHDWSAKALAKCAEYMALIASPIIYAEVSAGYTRIEALDAALPAALYEREPPPWETAFLAGKCFLRYRSRGGPRPSPLPDLFIGAHAAIEQLALLPRDAARYQSYFSSVVVLAPGVRPL